jgi:hypothetical protein
MSVIWRSVFVHPFDGGSVWATPDQIAALGNGFGELFYTRRIDEKALASLRIDASHRAGLLHIVVSDDGRGIDRDRLRRNGRSPFSRNRGG